MDYDRISEEWNRLMDALAMIDPCSSDYEIVSKRLSELHKMYLAEDKSREEQMEKRHRQEMEEKRLDLEERKLNLDAKKFEAQEKNDAQKNAIEKEKLDIDRERNMLEDRKLDIQEADNEEKNRIEEEKAQAMSDENHSRARYTKSQAMWRLVEIGAQGVVTIACIVMTGKIQETSILDSKLWSLVWKPKV